MCMSRVRSTYGILLEFHSIIDFIINSAHTQINSMDECPVIHILSPLRLQLYTIYVYIYIHLYMLMCHTTRWVLVLDLVYRMVFQWNAPFYSL